MIDYEYFDSTVRRFRKLEKIDLKFQSFKHCSVILATRLTIAKRSWRNHSVQPGFELNDSGSQITNRFLNVSNQNNTSKQPLRTIDSQYGLLHKTNLQRSFLFENKIEHIFSFHSSFDVLLCTLNMDVEITYFFTL